MAGGAGRPGVRLGYSNDIHGATLKSMLEMSVGQ